MPRKLTVNSEDTTHETKVRKVGRRKVQDEVEQNHEQNHEQNYEQTHEQPKKENYVQKNNEEKHNSDWEEGTGGHVNPEDQNENEGEGSPIQVSSRSTRTMRETVIHREPREPREPRREYRNLHSQPQREYRQPRETEQHQRPKSAALSFSYNDYKNFNEPANQASTPNLLRVLIARAHDDGQVHLKRCLETTLRAVNLECKFPTLPPPRRNMTGGNSDRTHAT